MVSAGDVLVIATDNDDRIAAHGNRKNARRGICTGNGCGADEPRTRCVIRGMEDARGNGAAGGEVDAAVRQCEGSSTGCECAFTGKSWRHLVAWKFLPESAVTCAQKKEFSDDGIADGVAIDFGCADQIVQENCLAGGVFERPMAASVGCFVDARGRAGSDGHDIGDGGAEGLNGTEIERIGTGNRKTRPGFAAIR